MKNNKELMSKYYQDDDYIKVINSLSNELLEKYNNGDLIDVKTYQEKYDWFPLEWDKEKQKYIFNKEQVERFTKIYNEDMIQDDYYIKFFIDSQNNNLRIISKELDDEIAVYIPEICVLTIEKKKLDYFNKIRKDFYSTFPVEEESYWEVGDYKNN
jgi:hypothetical protein